MIDTTVLPPSQRCFPFSSRPFFIFNFGTTVVYVCINGVVQCLVWKPDDWDVQHIVLRLVLKDYGVVCVVSVLLGLWIIGYFTAGVQICRIVKKIVCIFDLRRCPIRRLESSGSPRTVLVWGRLLNAGDALAVLLKYCWRFMRWKWRDSSEWVSEWFTVWQQYFLYLNWWKCVPLLPCLGST